MARWIMAVCLAGAACCAAGAEVGAAVVRDLPALSVRGVNYYPRETSWGGMWTRTPPEVWERDLALAASLGINTVRTFVSFSPAVEAAGLLEPDGTPAPAYIEKIGVFLDAAWRNGIRVILCFDFDAKRLGDGAHGGWRAALGAVSAAFGADGRVLLWDLMNEPDDDAKWTPAVRSYLAAAEPVLRASGARQLVTVGLTWRVDRLEEVGLPEVIQYHEYCPKGVLFEAGAGRVCQTVDRMRRAGGERPVLIGEFGLCTSRDPVYGAEEPLRAKAAPTTGDEAEQARVYEIVLDAAERSRIAGVLAWCLHDYPIRNPNESHFGLVRLDGSLKPAADVLRNRYRRWAGGAEKGERP